MFWSWFPFALAAVVCFGISGAFYKLPAVKKHSHVGATFWLLLTGSIIGLVLFHKDVFPVDRMTLILTLAAGATFAIVTMLQMYALNHADVGALFPLTTTLSLLVTILVGLLFFGEHLNAWQGAGIALAIGVVYSFSRSRYKGVRMRFSPTLLWLVAVIPLMSATFKIIQKLAADSINIRTFQIYAYFFGAVLTLAIYLWRHARNQNGYQGFFSGAMTWGSLNGVFSFLGGAAILVALTRGPFILITPMQSLYVVATALFGYLFLKEDLGWRKWMLILLSIAAVVLMSLG